MRFAQILQDQERFVVSLERAGQHRKERRAERFVHDELCDDRANREVVVLREFDENTGLIARQSAELRRARVAACDRLPRGRGDSVRHPRRNHRSSIPTMATVTKPDRLHFTGNDDADALIAREPFALLVGFALDQQVPVQTAFTGPLKIKQRLGTLDPRAIASTDPATLEAAFRQKPAVHRFPGTMAQRVQDLARTIVDEYDGDAARLWDEAADGSELRRRIESLPGFGRMKVIALGAVLAKRFGVASAQE